MTQSLAYKRGRYKFISRFGAAKRKPHARKQWKNNAGPNEFANFEQFGLEHTDCPKTIVATNRPLHPVDDITLPQTRFTNHMY